MNKNSTLIKAWKRYRYSTYSPVYWHSKKNISSMHRIHQLASRNDFLQFGKPPQLLIRLLLLLSWPFRMIELCIYLNSKFGNEIFLISNKSRRQQFIEQIYLSLKFSMPPKAYYQYTFSLPEQQEKMPYYIYDHEVSNLFPALNSYNQQKEITDKVAFATLCLQNSLPHVATIAEFINSTFYSGKAKLSTRSLPKYDLFIKPTSGSKGKFCALWLYNNGSYSMHQGNFTFTESELIDFYLKKSEQQNFIVQARLKSHHSLADIANNAICCVRIVTIKRSDGTIELLSGVLKFPKNNESTNNVGLISAIETATGKLGRLYSYRAFCSGFEQHPSLHIDVQGRILPDWQKVITLAKDAHNNFPEYFSLGWDIAMTADGPILLETNQCWDVLTMQRAHRTPLGMTAFGNLCIERIEALKLK